MNTEAVPISLVKLFLKIVEVTKLLSDISTAAAVFELFKYSLKLSDKLLYPTVLKLGDISCVFAVEPDPPTSELAIIKPLTEPVCGVNE